MTEHWDVYTTTIEDKPASVFLNLGLFDDCPDPERPTAMRVSASIQQPTDTGFPTPEENEKLHAVEDALEEHVKERLDGVYAGRVTSGGKRDYYYYVPGEEPDVGAVMGGVTELFGDYEFEAGILPDPEWKEYLEYLFPGPLEMQLMMNRQVISNLQDHGDPLEEPRPISHWLYFPTVEARSDFIQRAKEAGYELEKELPPGEEGEERHGVIVTHTAPATPDAMQKAIVELFELGLECDGLYDGLETQVLKPDAAE